MNPKISIIIPLFNVENYVLNCLESIFNQSSNEVINFSDSDIEYILVDDGCFDNTMELVFSFIDALPLYKKEKIKIFHNTVNRGLGYTRKFGLLQATGEYVLQIDSDDWIEYCTCEKMYQKAIQYNADIVVSDFFKNNDNYQEYIEQPYTEVVKEDFVSILLNVVHGSVGNKLIKRSLYLNNNIFPPENFSLYEDKITTLKLFFHSSRIVYIKSAFLHYRKNINSISSSISLKNINDSIQFMQELERFFLEKNLLKELNFEFKSCILYHKKNFLLSKAYYKYWDKYYPEVNHIKYVFGIKSYSWGKKIITILAMIFSKRIITYSYALYNKFR